MPAGQCEGGIFFSVEIYSDDPSLCQIDKQLTSIPSLLTMISVDEIVIREIME